MEIVAFDTDDRADGNGKAGITWISKTLLNTTQAMNATRKTVDGETAYTAGGWEHSDMRTYVKSLKSQLPSVLQTGIVEVTKVQSTYTGGALVVNGQTTTDDLWIPSNHEIFGTTTYESTGAVYTTKFNSATNRIKKCNGSAVYWWVRSADSDVSFRGVGTRGTDNYNTAYRAYVVALGFCTD